ncbi:hypothetical protein FRC07_001878 [Ceratobasidium sp. 392]|nr:hypothetical protein FRC07_001878 [Ceratobasidium sp. 392]
MPDSKQPWCQAGTFAGLRMQSDGSERTASRKPKAAEPSYRNRRNLARGTLGKVWHDMQTHVLKLVDSALKRKIILPFRVADFVRMREDGLVPVHQESCLEELRDCPTRLKAKDGPTVLVDLDDTVLFWYFPDFVGTTLRMELLHTVSELAQVYRPKPDDKVKDRRSQPAGGRRDEGTAAPERRSTRSQSRRLVARVEADRSPILTAQQQGATLRGHAHASGWNEGGQPPAGLALLDLDSPASIPMPYVESEGDVRWSTAGQSGEDTSKASEPDKAEPDDVLGNIQYLCNLAPFAYNFSPGWFQTGMHYIRPIAMSVHLREALKDECSDRTIQLLESKRLLDRKLSFLTDIIHASLGKSMREVRAYMSAVTGATSVVLENGWTSAFPCVSIAVNRTCALHRDTQGIRGGMDVISVLGTFSSGGELGLLDLNMEAEWKPGVKPWEGGTRVAYISFCRKSTWTGLSLDCNLSLPGLSEVAAHLRIAKEKQANAVEEAERLRKVQQAVERCLRADRKAAKKADRAKELEVEHRLREDKRATERAERAKQLEAENHVGRVGRVQEQSRSDGVEGAQKRRSEAVQQATRTTRARIL